MYTVLFHIRSSLSSKIASYGIFVSKNDKIVRRMKTREKGPICCGGSWMKSFWFFVLPNLSILRTNVHTNYFLASLIFSMPRHSSFFFRVHSYPVERVCFLVKESIGSYHDGIRTAAIQVSTWQGSLCGTQIETTTDIDIFKRKIREERYYEISNNYLWFVLHCMLIDQFFFKKFQEKIKFYFFCVNLLIIINAYNFIFFNFP